MGNECCHEGRIAAELAPPHVVSQIQRNRKEEKETKVVVVSRARRSRGTGGTHQHQTQHALLQLDSIAGGGTPQGLAAENNEGHDENNDDSGVTHIPFTPLFGSTPRRLSDGIIKPVPRTTHRALHVMPPSPLQDVQTTPPAPSQTSATNARLDNPVASFNESGQCRSPMAPKRMDECISTPKRSPLLHVQCSTPTSAGSSSEQQHKISVATDDCNYAGSTPETSTSSSAAA